MNKNTPISFDKLVLHIRQELNITQEQLARHLNVAFATVNRWENNKFKPSKMAEGLINKLYNKLVKNQKIEPFLDKKSLNNKQI